MPEALRDAWAFYRLHPLQVTGIALAVYAAVAVLSGLLIAELGVAGIIGAAYLWLAAMLWVQAPLAHFVASSRAGARPGVRETLERASRRLSAVSTAGALAALGVAVGLSVFVVPGLLLLVRWAFLVPAIVVEGAGVFTAFGRSRDVGRLKDGPLFGGVVGTIVVLAVLWLGVDLLGLVVPSSGNAIGDIAVAAAIATAVLGPFTALLALAWTMEYYELRPVQPAEPSTQFSVGRALDDAGAAYGSHPGRLLALGAVPAAALALVQIAVPVWAAIFVTVPASLGVYVFLEGVVAAGLDELGEPSGRRWLLATLRAVKPRLAALLAASIAATVVFATVVGLLLLVRWSVAGAAVVVERRGVRDAFRRSVQLARGRGGRVFKLINISVGVAAAISFGALALVPVVGGIWSYVAAAVANAAGAPYVALAWAQMYRRLRALDDSGA